MKRLEKPIASGSAQKTKYDTTMSIYALMLHKNFQTQKSYGTMWLKMKMHRHERQLPKWRENFAFAFLKA